MPRRAIPLSGSLVGLLAACSSPTTQVLRYTIRWKVASRSNAPNQITFAELGVEDLPRSNSVCFAGLRTHGPIRSRGSYGSSPPTAVRRQFPEEIHRPVARRRGVEFIDANTGPADGQRTVASIGYGRLRGLLLLERILEARGSVDVLVAIYVRNFFHDKTGRFDRMR